MYKGYSELTLSDEDIAHFYMSRAIDLPLKENEYLVIKDKNNQIIDKYKFQDKCLQQVQYKTIKSTYMGSIKPQNIEQELAMDLLADEHTTVKLVRGVYGSGKLLAPFNREIN